MVDLAKFQSYPVRGFRGGLNLAVSSFNLKDDELRDCKNVEFSLEGSIRLRVGTLAYSGNFGDANPQNKLFRYNRSDGQREILTHAPASGNVSRDQGTMDFTTLTTLSGDNSGFIGFSQWKDTVFLTSRNDYVKSYYRGADTEVQNVSMDAGVTSFIIATSGVSAGNLSTSEYYEYRFTFDVYHGDDFIGETMPMYLPLSLGSWSKVVYGYVTASQQAVTSTGSIRLTRYWSGTDPISANPQWKYMNIYRSLPLSAPNYTASFDIDSTEKSNLYYIASVSRDQLTSLNSGDVFYEDVGDVLSGIGNSIKYGCLIRPPRSRTSIVHKNRMWYANVARTEYPVRYLEDSIDPSPYRIYLSEYNQPATVFVDSYIEIGPHDGEEIIALVSWENKALFVFKENSIYAIYGGDSESTLGIPDIQVERVSNEIGCVAQESIAFAEGGIVFLSNRGVEFFNGVTVTPMRSEVIDPVIDNIPGTRKPFACGIYTQDRKYRVAISDSTQVPGSNTVAMIYDFYTKTWTKNIYGFSGSALGISNWLELRKGDEQGLLLFCPDSLALLSSGVSTVMQHIGQFEFDQAKAQGVEWYATTKYFDCGQPHLYKTFHGIIAQLKSGETVTLNIDVDEGKITGSETIALGGNAWDDAGLHWNDSGFTWDALKQADTWVPFTLTSSTNPYKGRRISFKFSGTDHISGTEIQGLVIVYTPERMAFD